ncbi:MAG: hypothetical protein FWG38_09185, partial [Defluviitaleaceae bacterium]|nr:hypothetical protein [Defluviitaleaceae bacterium]
LAYGFGLAYQPIRVFDAAAHTPTVPVFQVVDGLRAEIGRVPLQASDHIYFELPDGFDTSLLRYEFSLPEGLAPPVEAGATLGSVAVYVQDFRIGNALLRAGEGVLEYTPAYASHLYYEETAEYLLEENAEAAANYAEEAPVATEEIFLTMVVPFGISGAMLVLSLIVHFAKRNKRLRGSLHARYARYPEYKYK